MILGAGFIFKSCISIFQALPDSDHFFPSHPFGELLIPNNPPRAGERCYDGFMVTFPPWASDARVMTRYALWNDKIYLIYICARLPLVCEKVSLLNLDMTYCTNRSITYIYQWQKNDASLTVTFVHSYNPSTSRLEAKYISCTHTILQTYFWGLIVGLQLRLRHVNALPELIQSLDPWQRGPH